MTTIFSITSKLTGKAFVSVTNADPKARLRMMTGAAKAKHTDYNNDLKEALRTHSFNDWQITVLEQFTGPRRNRRNAWIDRLNCWAPNGYNHKVGRKTRAA